MSYWLIPFLQAPHPSLFYPKKKMRLMKMLDNDAKIRINMKIKLGWRYSVMLNSKILYDTFAAHGSGGYRGWCC